MPKTARKRTMLERQTRARVQSISGLPTTVGVAMRLLELGDEAGPREYAKVIEVDPSMSARLLAFANSPWAGVRNRVTNIRSAVNLLGIGTVRTLALSYCMTGLHSELRLRPEEAQELWEASLFKAEAARQYASQTGVDAVQEAFVAGLLQDFGIPVMYAVDRHATQQILDAAELGIEHQLEAERSHFGMTHADIGSLVAKQLKVPLPFDEIVAFHHCHDELVNVVDGGALADAVAVASLFPHLLTCWGEVDRTKLCDRLSRVTPQAIEANAFCKTVQDGFEQICQFFFDGATPEANIQEILTMVAKASVMETEQAVGRAHALTCHTAVVGAEMQELLLKQGELERAAQRDSLTGTLNRAGLAVEIDKALKNKRIRNKGAAIVYVDIDHFKSINDTFGHRAGDTALKHVVHAIEGVIRSDDFIARAGGDEFVVFLAGLGEDEARRVAERMVTRVAGEPIECSGGEVRVRISAGVNFIRPGIDLSSAGQLIDVADALMYKAKRGGGNKIAFDAP